MKQIGTLLFLAVLTICQVSILQAQRSYFDLGFPSSKHPYPTNKSTSRVNPGIATGSSSGFYVRFGEDIAKLCANYGISLNGTDPNRLRFPKFRLNVYATQGGFDSVKRLRYEREVQLGIVQSDLRYFASKMYRDEADPRKKEAWRQIANSIKLVLPLYKEKIHIVVRPEAKGQYKDLAGLMSSGATVNIGQVSSGGMITCMMIEDTIINSRSWRQKYGNRSWRPAYESTEAALDMLVRPGRDPMDAVILVGGTPFPALRNFGMNWAIEKKLFSGADAKKTPQLALLPVGPEARELLCPEDHAGGIQNFNQYNDASVSCYVPDEIPGNEYKFMGDVKNPPNIDTVGVYACLVTHSAYGKSTGRDAHKIDWVRHILYRILTKLDQYSEYGLPHDFGIPRAGKKWKEVKAFPGMSSSEKNWEKIYGWPRHEDPIVRAMMDAWARGAEAQQGGGGNTIIDPITLF